MFKRAIKQLLLILIVTFVITGESLAQNIKFEHITDEDGLPQSVINCIYQDSYGFIWFGTQNGLARYDGYSMTVYQNKKNDSTSISNNVIKTMIQDYRGTLWVGTLGGGLNAYDYNKDEFKSYKNNSFDSNSISSNEILSLNLDKTGVLWIGTFKGGLCKYDFVKDRFRNIPVATDNENLNTVNTILITEKGKIWAGGDSSMIYEVIPEENRVEMYLNTLRSSKASVKSMVESNFPDILWVGMRGTGFASFNTVTKQFMGQMYNGDYNENETNKLVGIRNTIHDLYVDELGKIWLGTQEGLSIFDPYRSKYKNIVESNDEFGLSNSEVLCIFEDRSGSIWLGTSGGGVNVHHKKNLKFQHFKKDPQDPTSIRSNVVFSFLEDSDSMLWVGTYEGGITVFDRDNESSTHLTQVDGDLVHSSVLALHEDKDSIIWIGYYGGGIEWYDKKKNKVVRTFKANASGLGSNTIFCFEEASDGTTWIGNFKGIDIYDKATDSFFHLDKKNGLSNNIVTDIVFDGNYAWVSTLKGGLNRIDILNNYDIKSYPLDNEENGISNNRTNCIYDDQKGSLWIGTNNGLNQFDKKEESFKHFFKEDGLPDNYIYGILPDSEGNIWMSTNKGIAKLELISDTITPRSFKNYGKDDALQDNEFNQCAFYRSPRSGELLFGGVNGFNSFFPEEIKNNSNIPPVYITSIKSFDKVIPLDTNVIKKRKIELSYKENYLSFEFVGLDYFYPSKNKYMYKMEGIDEQWMTASSRRYISYPNLRGGDYTLRIKASNSDGVWNEIGTSLSIVIVPPFWETNWFYSLIILAICLLIWLVYTIRTRNIKRENKRLEKQVAIRTQELAQKNKDITSSIQYAKRLQQAILPSLKRLRNNFPDSFVLYKPKDIVSGDFYWFGERNGKKVITAVDCTGHGVPGAFMSMLGVNILNAIIIESGETRPDRILNKLHSSVVEALHQKEKNEAAETVNDGMDMSLITIDEENKIVQFSGAYNNLLLYRASKKELLIVKGDKQPIGAAKSDAEERVFSLHEIPYENGDQVFMFTDGFVDQFGGPRNKKFMMKRFRQLILDTIMLPKKNQEEELNKAFSEWMQEEEQVDDVLVIGIKL